MDDETGDQAAPISLTLPEHFESTLDHALGLMVKEVVDVGEVVLEIGAPNGWGPVGMNMERLEVCLER